MLLYMPIKAVLRTYFLLKADYFALVGSPEGPFLVSTFKVGQLHLHHPNNAHTQDFLYSAYAESIAESIVNTNFAFIVHTIFLHLFPLRESHFGATTYRMVHDKGITMQHSASSESSSIFTSLVHIHTLSIPPEHPNGMASRHDVFV